PGDCRHAFGTVPPIVVIVSTASRYEPRRTIDEVPYRPSLSSQNHLFGRGRLNALPLRLVQAHVLADIGEYLHTLDHFRWRIQRRAVKNPLRNQAQIISRLVGRSIDLLAYV